MTFLKNILSALGGGLLLSETALAAGTLTMGVPEAREIPVQVTASGPALLFSDSPERVFDTGVLYRDTVEGPVRIFVHHLNGTKRDLKLAVIVRPEGGEPVTITLGQVGISEPSSNYAKAAKQSQKSYFTPRTEQKATINRFQFRELLSNSSDQEAGIILKPDELVTGMVDFTASAKATVSVLMCEKADLAVAFNRIAPILPMDTHPLRGTYQHADLTYTVQDLLNFDKEDCFYIRMAKNDDSYFLQGIDATTGVATINNGNYGVVYKLRYRIKDKEHYALRINPSGGYFAGYALYINKDGKKLVPLPKGEDNAMGKTGTEMYTFATGGGGDASVNEETFIWSPPGAANLPIRFYWQHINNK